jgi:hypothetical protein
MSPRRSRAAVCLAAIAGLLVPAAAHAQWSREVADPGGTGAFYSSMVLEGLKVHVSYQDATRGALKYSDFFSAEIVDESASVGGFSSLALDGPDSPHVSYYDATHRRLKYAVKVGGAWQREVADADGYVGMYTSLALQSIHGTAAPCISYFDYSHGRLKYACKDGAGFWSTQVVDETAVVGLYTSLAIDAAGLAHISYYDATNGDLRYATRSTKGTWRWETVDSAGNVGQHTSLRLDADGHPHIAYYDATNRHLKYARSDGRGWTVETADAVDGAGQYASLALDSEGRAHIAYYDSVLRDLKYARQDAALAWTVTTLLSEGTADVGAYASLGLVDDGAAVMVTYSNRSYGSLRSAYWGPSMAEPFTQLIDGFDRAGLQSSSGRDSMDRPHVAHVGRRDTFDHDLRYSFKSGANWIGAVIDADGADDVSLCVDSSDGVHVAYSRDGAIWYAKKGATGWSRELVDPGPAASTPSLKVSGGIPSIAYVEGGEVKFAMRWPGGWGGFFETVDTGGSPALAIGPGGLPHVSYLRSGRLRYAHKIGFSFPSCDQLFGCWVDEEVDQDPGGGGQTSIVISAVGVPHISYHRTFPGDDSGELRFAKKTGGAWNLQTVDGPGPFSGPSFGGESEIALDAAGLPRIAYSGRAGIHTMIRLARGTGGGGFTIDLADASVPTDLIGAHESAVHHPSLTITAGDASCITYEDDRNGSVLKQACHP